MSFVSEVTVKNGNNTCTVDVFMVKNDDDSQSVKLSFPLRYACHEDSLAKVGTQVWLGSIYLIEILRPILERLNLRNVFELGAGAAGGLSGWLISDLIDVYYVTDYLPEILALAQSNHETSVSIYPSILERSSEKIRFRIFDVTEEFEFEDDDGHEKSRKQDQVDKTDEDESLSKSKDKDCSLSGNHGQSIPTFPLTNIPLTLLTQSEWKVIHRQPTLFVACDMIYDPWLTDNLLYCLFYRLLPGHPGHEALIISEKRVCFSIKDSATPYDEVFGNKRGHSLAYFEDRIRDGDFGKVWRVERIIPGNLDSKIDVVAVNGKIPDFSYCQVLLVSRRR